MEARAAAFNKNTLVVRLDLNSTRVLSTGRRGGWRSKQPDRTAYGVVDRRALAGVLPE
jgi:hypothetical protein